MGCCALLLFDSDGTTFVVDNTANTSVCNYSLLLIGLLIDYNVSLDTTNGVGVHHQNISVEQRIRTVTKIARTIILHAQRYWPECVETMLWPFTVKVTIERLNFLQLDLDGNTPTAKFYNIKNIKPNAHEYHTFVCPFYVLNYKPQSGSVGPKNGSHAHG